jgi:hypothetical protein
MRGVAMAPITMCDDEARAMRSCRVAGQKRRINDA